MQERENLILGRKDYRVRSESMDDDGSNSGSPPLSSTNSKSSSKRHHSMMYHKTSQDRYNDIREEEVRTNARIKEEEARLRLIEIEKKSQANAEEFAIRRMEVEARMMEARNKERELKNKEAYDMQMLEILKSSIKK